MISRINAVAKVNLFLLITGRRKCGKHNICSLAAFCDDITDTLKITERKDCNIVKYDNLVILKEQHNILRRTLDLASLHIKRFFHLSVKKNIPVAAGLGGGSADVAAVLKYFQSEHNLDTEIAKDIAKSIGSDIVACLDGQSCLMLEDGSDLRFTKKKIKLPAVFLNPKKELLTKRVYDLRRQSDKKFSDGISLEMIEKMSTQEMLDIPNDLYHHALQIMPELSTMIVMLKKQKGCIKAKMSGSGATCFGVFESKYTANIAAENIKKNNPDLFVKFSWISG